LTIVLRACLLGALEVELDGTVIDSPATQRTWALFAYLALAGRPIPRAELANVFWPDVLDQSARGSLRSALWALRRQIGDRLVVDAEHVGLDGAWIDVREFERLAARDPDRALELCRGELLEGIEDEWALRARERHREQAVELLEQQARAAEERGSMSEAIASTRRQVERDPLDEHAHQRLIKRLAAAGDRAGAMRTYRMFVERLRRELGMAPSAATRELVEQLRVEAPSHRTDRVPVMPRLLPLVGRELELAQLDQAWRSAAGGAGTAALVLGEAGIGKTRLATELRLRAGSSGGRTATSAALDLGGTAPFSLWAELIRELLPLLPAPPPDAAWPDDLAVLVSELPAHFGRTGVPAISVAPDLQRTRLFEAVIALLGWAARDAPLLLVLEDAHDADAPSLELTGYAARRVAQLPAMMLITRRELPASAAADRLEHALRSRGLLSCELSLDPLTPAAVAALARNAARLKDADVEQVVERAEGNALLAAETARALERGFEPIAPNLRGSVRATLAPLSGDVRRLVEIAAVAARPMDPAEVDQLSLQEAATEALQTGLLWSDGGRIAFRHALLREAAFEEIAEPRRRTLHRAWAQALSDAGRAGAEVARHLRLAGADQAAVPQLVRAAEDARAVAALDQAVAYLEEALVIAPERPNEWLELGEIEAWRANRDSAEEAFQKALDLLNGGDPLTCAHAWLRRGRAYHGPICAPRAVSDSARNALDLLGRTEGSEEERSEALAACAWAEAVAGSVDEAERLLVELSHVAPQTDDLRTYDAGHARALALMRRGRFSDAYGPSIAAGEAISRAGRPDLACGCWANAASAATAAGEPERALEFLDRGMAALEGQGLQSLEIHLLAARSFVLRTWGRLDQAREAAEAEHVLAEQLAQPELIAMASHDRGLVALEAREYRSAVALLDAALLDQALISRPLTRLALAEALARDGQPERAAEQVRATALEPLRLSDSPDALVPRFARVQGLIARVRGDHEEAKRRLEESIAGWQRLVERTVRADSITSVLADLGRPVVGLVEPERELARARADLRSIKKGSSDAVVS
jgi:DNA-binding SARP family transcriptional activator/tetratricopeptide (TPR) repeat protein